MSDAKYWPGAHDGARVSVVWPSPLRRLMDPQPSPPDAPPPPRRSAATADFGPGLRAALRVAGVAFVAALALVLLDVLAGVRLPAAIRPALPWVLVAATLASITLLVGAIGMPKRPDPPGGTVR